MEESIAESGESAERSGVRPHMFRIIDASQFSSGAEHTVNRTLANFHTSDRPYAATADQPHSLCLSTSLVVYQQLSQSSHPIRFSTSVGPLHSSVRTCLLIPPLFAVPLPSVLNDHPCTLLHVRQGGRQQMVQCLGTPTTAHSYSELLHMLITSPTHAALLTDPPCSLSPSTARLLSN